MAVSLGGTSVREQQLWNTYMFWARQACDPHTMSNSALEITKPRRRVQRSADRFLQSVIFTAFAVEYRLKSVYEVLGISHRNRDTLGVLVRNFQHRVEMAQRLDGTGRVRLPAEWKRIQKKLLKLNEARNQIAHANYQQILGTIPSNGRTARRVAAGYFNAFVDLIRVTHRAIGNIAPSISSPSKARSHYASLKVRVP